MSRINLRRGDSFTIGIKLAPEYDTATFVSLDLESTYQPLNDLPLVLDGDTYRLEMSSTFTNGLPTRTPFQVSVTDTVFGVKKSATYELNLIGVTLGGSPLVNEGLDIIITVNPIFQSQEIEQQLFAILKGDSVTGVSVSGNNLVFEIENRPDVVVEVPALVEADQARDEAEIFRNQTETLKNETQTLRNQAQTDANLANTRANDAANSASQAAQVAFGGATGIDGLFPTAWIRPQQNVLGSRMSISRSGLGATFFDPSLQLRQALANTARFDYDPVTGNALGVLVESEGIEYSRGFGNMSTTYFSNFISGTGVTPVRTLKSVPNRFGVANACDRVFLDRGLSNTGSDQSQISQSVINLPIGNYRLSFWARTLNSVNETLRVRSLASPDFNITLTPSWQFYSFNFDNTLATTREINFSVRGTFTQQTVDFSIDELRLVQTSQISQSPILNLGASGSLTRPADILTQNLSSFNPVEGTIIVRARANSVLGQTIFTIGDGTTNNFLYLQSDGILVHKIGGGTQQTLNLGNSGLGNFDTYAISYTPTRVAISRNGGVVQSLTITGSIPVTTVTFVGNQPNASKHIHTYLYFPKAATDLGLRTRSNQSLYYGLGNDDLAMLADFSDLAFTRREDLEIQVGRTPESFRGTGSLVNYILRYNFPFTIQVINDNGSTYTLPTLPSTGYYDANTNWTLTHNAPIGTSLNIAIIPRRTA